MIGKKIKLIALLCFCFLITGCSSSEEAQQVRLSFVHGWGSAARTHVLMREYYEGFEEQHEDIILVSQPSSEASIAMSKVNDMLALDEMPNIVSTNGNSYYLENAVKREKALDLMPYINEDPKFEQLIHPSVFEQWQTADGKLYTIPDALEVMGYWYNETYFREAGIVDKRGNVAVPKTWEEFYEACEKLTAWNQKSKKLLNVYALEEVQIMENLFLARLAGESMEGLEMASKMPEDFQKEAFCTAVADFSRIAAYSHKTDSLTDARQYFIEGSTAIYFNGVWESEVIENSAYSEEIAYANYPTNYGKSLAYISPSSGYVICDSADERENQAAVEFLKYMLSKEIQTKLGVETGQAPSNPNVDNQLISEYYPLLGDALETAHDAQVQIRTVASVWSNEAIQIISKNLEKASRSETVLQQMIQQLNALF